jgi:hypothetical protein
MADFGHDRPHGAADCESGRVKLNVNAVADRSSELLNGRVCPVLPFQPNASVIPYKLTEFDIHDNLNMFQVTEPADYQRQHGLAYPEPTSAASSQQL